MYDGIIIFGFIAFFVAVIVLIYLACTKGDSKYSVALVALIAGMFLLGIILSVGGGSSDSSKATTTTESYNGKYGRGEQYDKDVYDAADAFGEDPDHVNDVYEALAQEMR